MAELAEQLNGDGAALIEAHDSGRVARFRSSATEELAEWLKANGYIDTSSALSAEKREQQTLQTAAPHARLEDVRNLVSWLEAGQA